MISQRIRLEFTPRRIYPPPGRPMNPVLSSPHPLAYGGA